MSVCVCVINDLIFTQDSRSEYNHQKSHNDFTRKTDTHIQSRDIQILVETHNPRGICSKRER